MKEIIKTIGVTIAVGAAIVLFVGMSFDAAEVESNNRKNSTARFLHEKYVENPDETVREIFETFGEENMYENGYLKPEYVEFLHNVMYFEEEVE